MQPLVFRIPTGVHPPGLIQQGLPATSVVIIGLSMAITLSILCNKRQSIVSAMSKQFFSTYLGALCASHALPVRVYDSAEAFWSECDPVDIRCLVLDVELPDMSGLD